MDEFEFKKADGVTALSASMTEFRYKKHAHEEYALGVTRRGIQQYLLDGSSQTSFKDGVMLFAPEQVHDGGAKNSEGIEYVMLYIKPKLFLELLETKEMLRFQSPIVYNPSIAKNILALAEAIFRDAEESLRSDLLLSLADSVSNADFQWYPKDSVFTAKAKKLIRGDLCHLLNLDDVSNSFGMSKFRFIRLFKANAGTSPYQYYLNSKIERARQIIEHDKDIYSAVTECGFVDLTHLNRHFKGMFGVTAREYLHQVS